MPAGCHRYLPDMVHRCKHCGKVQYMYVPRPRLAVALRELSACNQVSFKFSSVVFMILPNRPLRYQIAKLLGKRKR